jgi:hypothetical protein
MKIDYFKYITRQRAFHLLAKLTIKKERRYWPILKEVA